MDGLHLLHWDGVYDFAGANRQRRTKEAWDAICVVINSFFVTKGVAHTYVHIMNPIV